MDASAESFDAPPNSDKHAGLRDTAWMAGHYVEGRYLLGMITGENLFRVSDDDYDAELHRFIAQRISPRAASIFCTLTNAQHLMPFLRRLYDRETDYPPITMSRNGRVERGIEYLLHNLDASVANVAEHLRTTEKQIMRLTDITAAMKAIRLHRESASA